jgi:hypothetical protein
LQTDDGIPTTVTFGFVRTLLALVEQEQPDALVVVFDAPGGSLSRSVPMQEGAAASAADRSGQRGHVKLWHHCSHPWAQHASAVPGSVPGSCIVPVWVTCVNSRHPALKDASTIHAGQRPKGIGVQQSVSTPAACRRELLPGYKAHRTKPAPEFNVDLANLRVLLHFMRMPTLSMSGYEADDVSAVVHLMACCQTHSRLF